MNTINKQMRRRLAALEENLIAEPTILMMPDGSTAAIPGGDYLLRLLGIAVREESASPEEAAHLDLIRCSTGSREPDGARIVDLIDIFLHGPAEENRTEHSKPMRAIVRRVGRLEERYETQLSPKKPLRVFVTRAGKDADLAKSTCQRYLRDGILTEIVQLDGGADHLSDEEIEKFVESFPIKTERSWRAV
jgi:hypothetical protein